MNRKMKELLGNKKEDVVILVADGDQLLMENYLRNFYLRNFQTEVEIKTVDLRAIGDGDGLLNLISKNSEIMVYVNLNEVSPTAIEIAHRKGCVFASLRMDRREVKGWWYNIRPDSLFAIEDLEMAVSKDQPIGAGTRE